MSERQSQKWSPDLPFPTLAPRSLVVFHNYRTIQRFLWKVVSQSCYFSSCPVSLRQPLCITSLGAADTSLPCVNKTGLTFLWRFFILAESCGLHFGNLLLKSAWHFFIKHLVLVATVLHLWVCFLFICFPTCSMPMPSLSVLSAELLGFSWSSYKYYCSTWIQVIQWPNCFSIMTAVKFSFSCFYTQHLFLYLKPHLHWNTASSCTFCYTFDH